MQQEREQRGFSTDSDDPEEKTTIQQLKQMKIIPLKNQEQLVSIEQIQEGTILFPLEKTIQYQKYLRLVYDDLPTLDGSLIDLIEKKYPHRLESIKALLKEMGKKTEN